MPNERLRALLAESGWTGTELARAVNGAGNEIGLSLTYGRASVSHWLSGVQPKPPVPPLIAEALSRRLSRPLTIAAVGMSNNREAPTTEGAEWHPWWCRDLAGQLVRLADVGARRDPPDDYVYQAHASPVPGWNEAVLAYPLHQIARHRPVGRVGLSETSAAESVALLASESDATLGGGSVRPMLARYLSTTVAPWLRASADAATRRQLLATALELTCLCGFACYDDELHGAAQRYYRVALQLAAEAADPVRYAIVLRAMSMQAITLRHHRSALSLAEAAVKTGQARAKPTTRAFLLGQLAVAAAATGDRRQALRHLHATEKNLERGGATSAVIGSYNAAKLAHQRAAVQLSLGDRLGALASLRESIRLRPPHERRSRAIVLAALAQFQLREGQVYEAANSSAQFLDDYPLIRSGRVRSALTALRGALRPYQDVPAVRMVLSQATALTAATAS